MIALQNSATGNCASNPACAWSLATLARWLKGEAAAEPAYDSWNAIWEWGARHRCGGIIFRAAAEAQWLDERDRQSVRRATYAQKVRAMSQVAECLRIEAQLRRRKIPMLFVKGVVLGDRLYNDVGLRAGGDIDLLVDVEDILRALAGLLELGYAPIGPSVDQVRRSWKAFSKFDNHLRFHNPERGVLLELHWRLFREHRILESAIRDSLHAERSRRDSADSLPSLRPALSFVYLVEHGAKHSFYAAQWLIDTVMQWRKLSNQERSEARWLVQRYAVERKLSLAREMATRLLDVNVRDERWPCCPPTPRFVMTFALKRFFASDPAANVDSVWHLRNLRCQLALSGKWREHASLLLCSTVTTPTLLQLRIPAPFFFLYPFLRFVLLVARVAGMRPRLMPVKAVSIDGGNAAA